MGVIMQSFYWDCPRLENMESAWWNHLVEKVPELNQAGFTALWLPPLNKAANLGGMSMGYDPYDYYDLGDIDQKGSQKTWFGSKDELVSLINNAHEHGLCIYADLVLNHNNGADEQELNELDNQMRWTKFNPKSGRFPRNWRYFHPSPYERWDNMVFEGMPDLCHRNPDVYAEMIEYARWLIEEIKVDGFRYDCVKGYGGWLVRAIQELRGIRDGQSYKPYGVGECWSSTRSIEEWMLETNAWNDNPVGAFDFPLRDLLKGMCDTYDFDMTLLATEDCIMKSYPMQAVTFVENHDVARTDPIISGKIMAYAYILTHEGYPCVFWQDYYNWDLRKQNNPSGIDCLVAIHERYAGGETTILYCDHDIYIMQRNGWLDQKGLVLVLNNRGEWNGHRVLTNWNSQDFNVAGWCGEGDNSRPEDITTNGYGAAEFYAPPRGYAIYVPV
jgi:alpha-amylase